MSKNKKGMYKPVECQDLQKEINGDNPIPSPVNQSPFKIVGKARISKTGLGVSIHLFNPYKVLSISRKDIELMLEDENHLTVCIVREYVNDEQPKIIIA